MLYTQHYLEVVKNENEKWNIELVIAPRHGDIQRTIIAKDFATAEEGDKIAEPMRFQMDKIIYKSDIN